MSVFVYSVATVAPFQNEEIMYAYQRQQRQQHHSILQMFYEYIDDGVGISFPFTTLRLAQENP